jgi:alpha,alpha-trehalase
MHYRGLTSACTCHRSRSAGEGSHMSTTPIADYALLSDRHSAALVSRDGSTDWLCFPRIDGPSIFARLLGDEAGHWSLGATGATQVTRRYLNHTMVLETTYRTPTGTVVIADARAGGMATAGMSSASLSHLRDRAPTDAAG